MKTDSVWINALSIDSSLVDTKIGFDKDEPARAAILSGGEPDLSGLPIVMYEKYPDGPISDLPLLFDGGGGTEIFADKKLSHHPALRKFRSLES